MHDKKRPRQVFLGGRFQVTGVVENRFLGATDCGGAVPATLFHELDYANIINEDPAGAAGHGVCFIAHAGLSRTMCTMSTATVSQTSLFSYTCSASFNVNH